jgi:hypothetical protein
VTCVGVALEYALNLLTACLYAESLGALSAGGVSGIVYMPMAQRLRRSAVGKLACLLRMNLSVALNISGRAGPVH